MVQKIKKPSNKNVKIPLENIIKQTQQTITNKKYIKKTISKKVDYTQKIKQKCLNKQNSFLCPICLDYICLAATTQCSHTFCRECLLEYIEISKNCIVCNKNLRNIPEFRSITLDDQIYSFIKNQDEQNLKAYEERKKAFQNQSQWLKQEMEKLQVGNKLDVRDTNFIWCEGIVLNKSDNLIYELAQNSERIMPHGFYTNQCTIPHYDEKFKDHFVYSKIPKVQLHQNGESYFIIQN
ncbi:hypothetical protein PPERSA_10020 [Pseudocohnilembus persalinus]|uniref:RING-type domain-containing protein n=1 Tax=Pseudocohnilembus persalinus TaxID=266149 RepID=A0A0V0QJB3_PSEPJ|nr:hypothetical protein PPERSA_10020 [Pseudocohnilembus persalinus]|eukprot:KRX02403.1 hypothetical protein PPERSA_10020 [Pseudocohnilembus persalinus]